MNSTKKMKRILAMCVSVMIIIAALLPMGMISAFAQASGMDILLVVDDTGSMKYTDPGKLTQQAIQKFVDVLPSGVDFKLGVATYSDKIEKERALGHTPEEIKQFAETEITQSGDFTDAAVGINWAMEQFEQFSDASRKKAIVLVGDGENDYGNTSEAASNKMLEEAIAKAESENIEIYTMAINPKSAEFRQYFADVAAKTKGKAYEPADAAAVEDDMKEIMSMLTGGKINPKKTIKVKPGVPVTETIDVPEGVFEMNLQCDHDKNLDIHFTSPDGNVYNEGSAGIVFSKQNNYTNIKVQEPMSGEWKVTYTSDEEQTITIQFIFHANLTVELTKNQQEVKQGQAVEYIATVLSNNIAVNDEATLSTLTANLVITPVDNPEKVETAKMSVDKGKFVSEYKIGKAGKYEIYTELVGAKSTIKSNVLTIDVIYVEPLIPTWLLILIIVGVILLIIILIIVYNKTTKGPGTGYVRGNVSIKIVGRQPNDETMIFTNDKFNCEQVFEKKNTLSDLISAYTKRYRINNSSELAELTLSQYINSTLSEVTDKISICGNKKKQTIIGIPSGYEMQVDGMDILKPKTMIFNSFERAIEIRFKNMGCSYTINLIFTRE